MLICRLVVMGCCWIVGMGVVVGWLMIRVGRGVAGVASFTNSPAQRNAATAKLSTPPKTKFAAEIT